MTGEYSESVLASRVGLIVNDEDLGTVPLSQTDPLHFKYYKLGLHGTDVAQVYLADENDNQLVKAEVPIVES